MLKFSLRTDEYGRNFYIVQNGALQLIPYHVGDYCANNISFSIMEEEQENALKISITVSSHEDIFPDCFGFRLGIDSYMDSYPQWNRKFFPTALRCEKSGFWSCFMSPEGKMLSVCSPSKIVSWKNEYNGKNNSVGHRIYTSSIEFINSKKQPSRHPQSDMCIKADCPLHFDIFYTFVSNEAELFSFVEKYAGIHIPQVNKFTLEKGEQLVIDNKPYEKEFAEGIHFIQNENNGELTAFVRKDWFYYLDCAQKYAHKCQQKPGTHCESWYGFFTMVGYAKIVQNKQYTENLCRKFDSFFSILTKGRLKKKFRKKALPHRLQNASSMISLLTDFYELSGDRKYLDYANDMAQWLMKLQSKTDGSYRSHKTHYTCVIYPAKSMLELSVAEKNAGFTERSRKHFQSAKRAVLNLFELMDNIETEGEMTFEDGMISCESLQMAYLALLTDDIEEKQKLTQAAEIILRKHKCLEQQFLPDCRTRGCTLRFWEARYDINFFANMLNCPHGWTSWKNYATYYLYLLTGNLYYLRDLMNTMGACMQCVREDGELMWSYVADPCVSGLRLKKNCTKDRILFEESTVGEEYLSMISDWYRQSDSKLIHQYIRDIHNPLLLKKDYGGSCDNDVHEHFKCLCETVFGKAFIHEKDDSTFETYNCFETESGFESRDAYLKYFIVYAQTKKQIVLHSKSVNVNSGINIISINQNQ